jgi:hypothetical protein
MSLKRTLNNIKAKRPPISRCLSQSPRKGTAFQEATNSHANRLKYLFKKEVVKEGKKGDQFERSLRLKELQTLVIEERGFELNGGEIGSLTGKLIKAYNDELIEVQYDTWEKSYDEAGEERQLFDIIISKKNNETGELLPFYIVFTCIPYPELLPMAIRFVPTGEHCYNQR